MDIIFAKSLLRLMKERGYEDAKAFLGACGKDYSNLLKMLRGGFEHEFKVFGIFGTIHGALSLYYDDSTLVCVRRELQVVA